MSRTEFSERIPKHLQTIAEPRLLTGFDITLMRIHNDLHVTEASMALGINSAALYGKQSSHAPLQSALAILLRLYAAEPSYLPRTTPPSVAQLLSKIKEIDPEFQSYSIGPLLGIEADGSYRRLEFDFDKASQTSRMLAWVIYRLLEDKGLEGWKIIRGAVETEAQARNIVPASNVWRSGGWRKHLGKQAAQDNEANPAKDVPAQSPTEESAAPTTKRLVRRKASTNDSSKRGQQLPD